MQEQAHCLEAQQELPVKADSADDALRPKQPNLHPGLQTLLCILPSPKPRSPPAKHSTENWKYMLYSLFLDFKRSKMCKNV